MLIYLIINLPYVMAWRKPIYYYKKSDAAALAKMAALNYVIY